MLRPMNRDVYGSDTFMNGMKRVKTRPAARATTD